MKPRTRFIPCDPCELQVDLDSEVARRKFLEVYPTVRRLLKDIGIVLLTYSIERSKSPGHYHVNVFTNTDLSPIEQIALQSLLGSDPVRECCNFRRVRRDDPYPILFIED